jgi:nuclear polyadenylated RNA-binding protein NAB2
MVRTSVFSIFVFTLNQQNVDRKFTDWLFAEAAKGAPDVHPPPVAPPPQRQPEPALPEQVPNRDPPPHLNEPPSQRRQPPPGPRSAPLYQQAISQALPTGTKRTASARSPSPTGHVPIKARRTDLPAGPRAMFNRDGGSMNGSRSLLERVGPRGGGPNFDDSQQARFDQMGAGNFPNGMGGMDMSGVAAMGNPMMLQEMMMNQMALMAQMAGAMGMVNAGQYMNGMNPGAPGFPDMSMMNGMTGVNGFMPQQPQQQQHTHVGAGRGRATGRGSSNGRGRGRGASNSVSNRDTNTGDAPSETTIEAQPPPAVVAPQPTPAVTLQTPAPTTNATRTTFVPPERPQSPTLCKFGLKCTNPSCRFSHPSPVATAESGVVLSNDPCDQGKDCKDKDCIKAHVSPAVLNPKGMLLFACYLSQTLT